MPATNSSTKTKQNNITPDDVLTWQKEQAARLLQAWKDFCGEDMETCDPNAIAVVADTLNQHFLFVNIPGAEEDLFEPTLKIADAQVMEGEEETDEDWDDDELDEDDEDDDDDDDLDEDSDFELDDEDSDLEEDSDSWPLDERDDEDEPEEDEE